MSTAGVRAVLDRVACSVLPDAADLVSLLSMNDPAEVREILDAADRIRRQFVGDGVLLRGIVEFGSFCSNTCSYCGLHAGNTALTRYRLSAEEILASVDAIAAQGIQTVVLQSGEDAGVDPQWLARIVEEIKARHGISVTLSVGEWPRSEYALWRSAGADRFLLKIESSDRELYESLHDRRVLSSRLRCLEDLADLGYQVGSGIMVGLKGQSLSHIARDILFFRQGDFDMIGIGPFLPHPQTRLADQARGDVTLTLKTLALTRIVTRDSHLPATTSLGSMGEDYRPKALQSGANVLMPNFTPAAYKKLYEIYPGKRCVSEPTGACAFCMEGMVSSIGRFIDYGRGDSLKAGKGLTRPLTARG
jgi:biotin synthase